jgi:hypothetical protein
MSNYIPSQLSSSHNIDLLNLDNISESSFNNNQYLAECPVSDVWSRFTKGEEKAKGHYSTSCKYCPKTWNRGTPFKLKAHLANECPGCYYSR